MKNLLDLSDISLFFESSGGFAVNTGALHDLPDGGRTGPNLFTRGHGADAFLAMGRFIELYRRIEKDPNRYGGSFSPFDIRGLGRPLAAYNILESERNALSEVSGWLTLAADRKYAIDKTMLVSRVGTGYAWEVYFTIRNCRPWYEDRFQVWREDLFEGSQVAVDIAKESVGGVIGKLKLGR